MTCLKAETLGNLRGRVALVTGGATGIGRIIAKAYAENGATVYVTGRREDVLRNFVARHPDLKLIPIPMDITKKDSIESAVRVLEEAEGNLDVLVNNAGIPGPVSHFMINKEAPENANLGASLFKMHEFAAWHEVLDTNLAGAFFVTTAFLELLEKGAKARGVGETSCVINISSACASSKLSLDMIPYGSLKAALDHLTTVLATEFARNQIPVRVNGIAPGLFPSEMTVKGGIDIETLGQKPFLSAMNPAPLKRIGKDEEMAAVAVFLASSGGGFTNGVSIRVDGGHNLLNP
ncbi:short-chain dehydrogenase [Moniliophthora roreri MCA 2997]|uniref:Short-chain dehydrogenase n=2 Tax=Moniliophthora roreri TaxID=221103 RepID=V2XNB4_MONRO|nr:short-chain dehydrogenase [Moniliophthora roreri MCA 2997]KAI3606416.1 short-chain dehydrogenase [Moniliophthora roreri]